MTDAQLAAINLYLQYQLERQSASEVGAVQAANWLHNSGLLKDSAGRPGLPLRNLLRQGKLLGQRQEGNHRWFIDRVNISSIRINGVAWLGTPGKPTPSRAESAARTRKHRRAGKKAWRTRRRREVARKAAATRSKNAQARAAGEEGE